MGDASDVERLGRQVEVPAEEAAQPSDAGSASASAEVQHTAHMLAMPPLHKAAAEGDVVAVLTLLLEGVDPNEEDAPLGETPVFEAAAVDATAAVGLLLLFGADPRRRGRHTSAIASEFAPAGGATAELLSAWERGDRRPLTKVLTPALSTLIKDGSEKASQVVARLERLEAEVVRKTPLAAACAGQICQGPVGSQAVDSLQFSSIVFGNFSDWVPDVTEPALPCPASRLRDALEALRSRLANQASVPRPHSRLLSPDSAAAQALWATVAAYAPQAALSVLPSTCSAMAELLLGDSDDAAWHYATGCVAHDVAASNRRRYRSDGQPVSWRSTFQELVSQKVFCWGTDGIITGFGARAPVKLYSRPRALLLEPQAAGAVLMQPFVRDIACGRRHSAAVTFSGSVYVWGRDVAPPVPPPEEARAGVEAWAAWRATQGRFTTSSDRPRRLQLGHALAVAPPLRGDSEGEPENLHVVGLSATGSVTLLRLQDGQTVCTGGWTAQEAQLPERVAEAVEARRRAPRLPPLRKITRGFCFNVALSRDGRVFVWRHSGLVPTGFIDMVPVEPTSIMPPGDLAADIAVGEGHVLILTENGRVWSFGWRQLSALGRGQRLSTVSAIVPTMINGLERIVQIAAGATYSLCVDVDGSLWLFGEGPCITGCFEHPTSVHEPRRVPASIFGGRCVLSAACGDGHVLALTAWDPCRRLLQPGAWFADADRCNQTSLDGMQDVAVGEWVP